MDIPPLSSSFLSVGFINLEVIQGNEKKVMEDVAETFGSFSIDMVEVEDQEARDTRLPPFSCSLFWHLQVSGKRIQYKKAIYGE